MKKPLFPLLLLFLLITPSFLGVLKIGYFSMHDDLQAMRQLVMDKCFVDGQIPCRWSQDLGYGYGYPLFNFYPPLPYYFGQIIHWVGFSFVDTFKVLVVLNLIASGLTMYLLAKTFWGRWGGFISALLYVYAPYHALDIYVRAAINEAWALIWMPAIFWATYKLIVTRKKFYIPLLAIFTAFLALSHNPILMVFAPGVAIWAIFWLIYVRNFTTAPKLVLSGLWAFGLSAFFTLPVIFEQKYAHVESLVSGYFNYLAHFATIRQLFINRDWGFGDSRYGPVDFLSFQIGHIHWILALLAMVVALQLVKKKLHFYWMITLMFVMTLFYTFMAHERSSPIWQIFPQLQFLQFPWRFLTLSIFGTSFLAGAVIWFIKDISRKLRIAFIIVLSLGIIFFYKDYFAFNKHFPGVTDDVKFSGEFWRLQVTSGIFDYLPIWAPLPPVDPPNSNAEMVLGDADIKTISKNSIKQEYKVNVNRAGVFQINTFYFPGWKYFIDGKEVFIDPYEDKELGRPRIKLLNGQHIVKARFANTPIRNVGNGLSVISWLILFGVVIYPRFRKAF